MAKNDNLLDLDIILRLPQPKDFATQLRNESTRELSAGLKRAVDDYQKAQERAAGHINKKLSTLALKSLKSGFGTEELGDIAKKYSEILEEKGKSFVRLKALEETSTAAMSAAEKQLHAEQIEHAKAVYALRGREARREYSNIMKYSIENSNKFSESVADAFKEGVVGGLSSISSGDIEGITTGIASGFSAALAKGAQFAASRAEGGGEGAAGMEGIAKMLGGLSKAAMGLSLAVGAVAALLAVFNQIDEKFKEMNKTLMNNSSAADIAAMSTGNLTQNLADIRDVVTNFGLNTSLGTTAEELNELTASIAKFGTGGILRGMDTMENLRNSLTYIATYAKLTGESLDSMTTSFSEYGERMRMSIEDVAGAFSNVLDSAVNSGVGVNRFQSAVFQATANTALYNKRLEETANLLDMLTDYVDFETATSVMTSAGSRYQGMGIQDRLQTEMTTSDRGSSEIFENELRDAIRDLGEGQRNDFVNALTQGMSAAGLSTEGDIAQMLKTLLGASGEAQRMVRSSGAMRPLQQTLNTLLGLTQGAMGGETGRALNLDLLSNTGSLAYRMIEGREILGGRSIDELGLEDRMLLEQTVGMDSESFRQLMALEPVLLGEFENMQRLIAAGDAAGLSAMGLSLRDGAAFAGDDRISSFQDYVMRRGISSDEFQQQDAVSEDISLLREVATNTQSFGDIIQNGVTDLLASIYSVISPMANAVMGWIVGEAGGAGVRESVQRESIRLQEERDNLVSALRSAQEERDNLAEGQDSAALDAFIQRTETQLNANRDAGRQLGTVSTSEEFEAYRIQNRSNEYGAEQSRQTLAGLQRELYNSVRLEDAGNALVPIMMREYSPSYRPSDAIRHDIDMAERSLEEFESLSSGQEDANDVLERILQANEDQLAQNRADAIRTFLSDQFGSRALQMGMAMGQGDYSGFTPGQLEALRGMGVTIPARGAAVNDFIYQSTGSGSRITPIHSQDEFYGAKPGGPIANAMGSNQNVVVNIYGATEHDVVKTMNTYMRAKGIQATRPAGRR